MAGEFKYEDCRLKHYIRTQAWLPCCKKRLKLINDNKTQNKIRRLKYFTFCAVGAIDVIMLDLERVIKKSHTDKFDTVHFFGATVDAVAETQKRIPGGVGYSGDFASVVLMEDLDHDEIVLSPNPLETPTELLDTHHTRAAQQRLETRRQLIKNFPFDVLNLDLEGYLFRPSDEIPGVLIRALKKLFQWQQKPFEKSGEKLDGFSLMFTTVLGPHNLTEDFLLMLSNAIDSNIQQHQDLLEILVQRNGCNTGSELKEKNFKDFFLIGAPKILAKALMDEDWFVDPESGIEIYRFERQSQSGPYSMIHLVMDVKRKNPTQTHRAPGTEAEGVEEAYRNTIAKLFANPEILITDDTGNIENVKPSLDRIKSRRRKYYDEE